MAGTIVADDLKHSNNDTVGTEYIINGSAKAYSYFNGTGTVAFRDSFNHSTLTDLGTGRYQCTMTSAMNNGTYSQSTVRQSYHLRPRNEDPTTTSYKVDSDYVSGTSGQMTGNDAARCHTIIVGELA